MGLDIYAGTLTRYYSHNWKTVVQQWAEEQGYSFNRIKMCIRDSIGPMLVGRELEELCWEPVALADPRLRPEWLEEFRQCALTGRDSLTLVGHARFERDGDGWQAALYHRMDYSCLLYTSRCV